MPETGLWWVGAEHVLGRKESPGCSGLHQNAPGLGKQIRVEERESGMEDWL